MSSVPGILINGTMFADSLVGTEGDDTINAGMGVDTIQANGGDDLISIGVGDEFSDVVHGGEGVDTLLVTVQDTLGSYWMPTDMYWVGYDAVGTAIGMITVSSSYGMAYADLALSGVRLKLNTGNGYPGAWIDGIENLSLWASQRDDSDDMLLLRGTGTYNGYGGFNGIYADWSALTTPITWNNQADATVQSVGGSSISNVQRLLLKSGAGNDDIRNTAVATDDEFETGAGNDTIYAGQGRDRVDAGAGDDYISVVVGSEFADTVRGGPGTDTLIVTAIVPESAEWQSKNMYFVGYDAQGVVTGQASAGSSTMANADAAISGVSLKLNTGNAYPGVLLEGIENLTLLANPSDDSNDMLFVIGTGTYNGYAGADALYANWSSATADIVWHNAASSMVQGVNGSLISNVERLLVRTGSGNDDIRNTAVATDDEFETGAGNDTIYTGGGRDRVDAGAGDDFISVVVGSEFADTVRGGSGTDTLVVTAIVPESSPWQSKSMYFVGYDAQGVVTGSASAGSSTMANADAALSGVSLKLNTGNAYPGVLFDGIENLTLLANPSDDSNDMLFVIGTGTYNGYAGADALYANWSSATADIAWNNLASSTAQGVNGSLISNVERLLVRTGSGNDDIRNTAVVTNDEFETGAGNDVVHAGFGKDRIDAGDGNDVVHLSFAATFEWFDDVAGGAGHDHLLVDATVAAAGFAWYAYPLTGPATYAASAGSASLAYVTEMLTQPRLHATTWNDNSGVIFTDIEQLSLQGSAVANDLLIVLGEGTHDGGGGTDTLYANWGNATTDIVWANLASSTAQAVNGSLISHVDRLLIRTGGGNDDLRNLVAGTNDEFETGAGNDRVDAGAGNDRIFGGSGNDTIDGGAGTDTAVFAGVRTLYTVTKNAAGTSFVLASAAEGTDWVSNVENFQFADGTVAASTFTTLDTTAPAAVGFNPADEATGVATTSLISVIFEEFIQRGSGFITLKNAAGDTIESFDAASSARLSIAGSTLTVDPGTDLASMTGYRLEFAAGSIRDLLGNGIALINSYNFTTGGASYTGTAGNDALTGDGYANVFTGLAGDDAINGLGGVDTAVYTGPRADYTISVASGVRFVNDLLPGRDGNDSLSSIERLRFADASIAYDMDGNAGTVAKLVGALFGAAALQDGALVGSYLSLLDSGTSVEQIAGVAAASGRFAQLAGSHSNIDFVETVYQNLAGVAPSTAERNELVSLLDSGVFTQATLAMLAAEHPLNLAHIDLTGLAGSGLSYGVVAPGTVQFGTSGPDVLTGTSANDQLYGLAGNDTLTGGTGNDSLEGGEGIDRAVLSGDSSHFGWSRDGSGWSVSDDRGPYTIDLVGIERLQFENRHVALDMDGAAGMTAKLLGAVFGASYVDNPEFVGIGLSVFDAGLSYEQVAQLALDARLGFGHTHQQAVELMYTNLIGVAPSPQESAELVALIDVHHVFTEASIAVYAAELPYNTANIDLVGLTQTGIEYVPA